MYNTDSFFTLYVYGLQLEKCKERARSIQAPLVPFPQTEVCEEYSGI